MSGLRAATAVGVVLVVAALVAVVAGAHEIALWLLLAVPVARNVVVVKDVHGVDRVVLVAATLGLLALYAGFHRG